MRLFFASDIHGSTTCFRKLVNAAAFYKVDHLLMGGDLAGKELVPVIADGARWRASFRGTRFALETTAEVAEFERRVGTVGAYTVRTDEEFVQQLREDQHLVEATLHRLALERTEEWIAWAVER